MILLHPCRKTSGFTVMRILINRTDPSGFCSYSIDHEDYCWWLAEGLYHDYSVPFDAISFWNASELAVFYSSKSGLSIDSIKAKYISTVFSDWYSGNYSGCFLCHVAKANDSTRVSNSVLQNAYTEVTNAYGTFGNTLFYGLGAALQLNLFAAQWNTSSSLRQVKIIGYRGTGTHDPLYSNEPGLIKLGHVGISFEGDPNIYGFHPSQAALTEYGDDLFDYLANGAAVEGQVYNDSLYFQRAHQLSVTNSRVQVWELSTYVSETDFTAMRQQVFNELNDKSLTITQYTLPLKPYVPMPPGYNNCATWPREIGINTPEFSGALTKYLEAMKELGAKPWNP